MTAIEFSQDTLSLPLQMVAGAGGAGGGGAASFTVHVNPLALLSILDSFVRRSDGQTSVVGALLGQRSENQREVLVKNCFPIPHLAGDHGEVGRSLLLLLLLSLLYHRIDYYDYEWYSRPRILRLLRLLLPPSC